MAGTLTVDTIQSDSSYASTLNVASKMNFAAGMQIGGQDTTFGGMRNRIINGDMRIDQRNAGASVTPTNGQYTVDRWYANQTTASKFSAQQNAGSVTPPSGFTNYLGTTSLSAYTPSSGDVFAVVQSIEGLNVADLNWGTASASTVTLSFWVRSSLTGTFGGCVNNNAQNRSYPFTYTISSANTWEQKSITVPGDTTGTWLKDNGVGIRIYFSLGSGSTYLGPAGSWANATYTSATGSTNVVGTNGATFYITGVQLEKGSAASAFENRQYGTELALCQRYYYLHASGSDQSLGDGSLFSATILMLNVNFPVSMRTAPTLVQTTGTNYYRFWRNGTNDDFNDFTYIFSATTRCAAIQAESNVSGTSGWGGRTVTNNASASIAFNSEL